MAVIITPEDIAPFADIDPAKLQAMIADAVAMAVRVAPCLKDMTEPDVLAAALAIIRGAILRWNESGTGAVTQATAGSFNQTIDTTKARRGMYWPSEISDLQGLCSAESAGAFTIDTAPASRRGPHSPICSLAFGATYCSCGSNINNYEGPLYEGGELS